MERSGDWHVGFETPEQFYVCYSVLATTAQIIKNNSKKSHWCRDLSGRLFRKPTFLVRECNMCVA